MPARAARPLPDPAADPAWPSPPSGGRREAEHPFKAHLDLCEIDDRQRPGPTWAARSNALGRSGIVVHSRRMSYPGRRMLLAVHLIDAQPTPLMGEVVACEYHADGLYRIDLTLLPVPDLESFAAWFAAAGGRRPGPA